MQCPLTSIWVLALSLIFIIYRKGSTVLFNKSVGHILRIKDARVNEGNYIRGTGVQCYPWLVSEEEYLKSAQLPFWPYLTTVLQTKTYNQLATNKIQPTPQAACTDVNSLFLIVPTVLEWTVAHSSTIHFLQDSMPSNFFDFQF